MIDWFASAKAFLDAMPKLDAALAELPAKVDFLTVEERREIDQTHIQILHQASIFVDFFDGMLEVPGAGIAPMLAVEQLGVVHHDTALQHDSPLKLLALGLRLLVFGLERDGFANSRLNLGKQVLRLFERKESGHSSRCRKPAPRASGCEARRTRRK